MRQERSTSLADPPRDPRPALPVGRLAVLAAVTALAPLSLDLYLPGLPELRRDLGGSVPAAQLTVTACILGLATGQFLAGILVDALGRRRPLLTGMAVWVLVTGACSLAPSLAALTVLRFGQGVCAGVGMAVVPAIIADLDRTRLVRHLARMMLLVTVVPLLAPSLGGLMLKVTTWRGLFAVLAGVGLLLTAIVVRHLPETLPGPRRSPLSAGHLIARYRGLLGTPRFTVSALVCGSCFGVLFTYLATSPFLFRETYGLGPMTYGAVFALNAGGLVLGMQVSPRLAAVTGDRTGQLAALGVGQLAALALLASSLVPAIGAAGVVVALFFVLVATGMAIPVASAAAIDSAPGASGSASGLLGTIQFAVGGGIGALAALAGDAHGGVPLGVTAVASLTLAVALVLTRRPAGRTAQEA